MTKAIVILVALALVFGWFALVRHIEHWVDKEFGGADDPEYVRKIENGFKKLYGND